MPTEQFEHDGRTFQVEFEKGMANISVLEGDQFRFLPSRHTVTGVTTEILRKEAQDRVKQFCEVEKRALKFRCDQSGTIYKADLLPLAPTVTGKEVWENNIRARCVCGASHRVFVR